MEYALGLLPDREDRRDLLMARLLPEVTLPVKYDCSEFMGLVRDQGDEGTCAGHASGAEKEWQEWADSLVFRQFSVRWGYEKAREIEPVDGEGTSLRAIVKAQFKFGVCEESFWPYVAGNPGAPLPGAAENAAQYKIRAYAKLNSIDEIMRSLVINGPCLLGLSVTAEWYDESVSSGFIPEIPKNYYYYGGHAICIAGFNRQTRMFKFKNSWGTDWGDSGYARISFGSIERTWISAWSTTDLIGGVAA